MGIGFSFNDENEDEDQSQWQADDNSFDTAAGAVLSEVTQSNAEVQAHSSIRDQAIRQMEQAELYKVLLENDLFAPGSARIEIQHAVEAEIKDFIEARLAELLNIQGRGPSSAAIAKSPFSEEEIESLKAFAAKILEKKNASQIPVAPKPQLKQIQATPVKRAAVSVAPTPIKRAYVKQVQPSSAPAPQQAQAPIQKALEKKQLLSPSGKVRVPTPKRKRMPSLEERVAMATRESAMFGNNALTKPNNFNPDGAHGNS